MSDAKREEVTAVYRKTGSKKKTSELTGVARSTVQRWLKKASEDGEFIDDPPVWPGFRVAEATVAYDKNGDVIRESIKQKEERGDKFEMPEGFKLKHLSAYVGPDKRVQGAWYRASESELDPVELAERVKTVLADGVPAVPHTLAPEDCTDQTCTIYPVADWHIGLHTWAKEVGESWDLKIAEQKIGEAVDSVVSRSPRSYLGIVLGGGDLTHSDDRTNTTPASKHPLTVDGRYPKVIDVAIRMLARTVDRALAQHEQVIVRLLEGNHDPHAHIAVMYALSERYREEPRVEVELSFDPFWSYQFGDVMLAATHGHKLRGPAFKEMPGVMAAYWPETWGATKFRYAHTFHYHHRERHINEHAGALTEVHQAPVPADSFSYGGGYASGRTFQSITYHRNRGERGRVIEPIG